MELMQEVKGYSDSREEEEEEEAAEEILTTTREESSSKHHYPPFSSPSLSLSSSPSATNHHHHHHHHDVTNIPPHQQNPWLGMIHDHHHHHHHSPDATESHNSSPGLGFLHQPQDAASSNFTNHSNLKQLDFMELSLGNNKNVSNEANFQAPPPPLHATTAPSSSTTNQQPIEKEHMFDKVVTPSDVGKLNRLVIPKQHAEKYFPLDSTSNEKGLLLNFEDRNGKLWRFRYSYWNSSQSYVMTKGWSRFVKEKRLDAGDTVSFQRGVGDLYRHRLYIDWRRRSNHIINGSDHSTTLFTPFFLPNHPPPHLSQYSIRWGATSRLYSLPSPQTPRHQQHDPLQQLNCNYHMYPFHQQHHGGGIGNHHYNSHEMSSGSGQHGSVYYMRSAPPPSMPMPDHQTILTRQQQEGGANISPMIIDSVPVAHHHHHHHHHQHGGNKSGSSSGNSTSTNTNTAAKRLRLFGVNMECGSSSNEDTKCYSLMSTTSVANVTMANSLPSSSLQPLQHLRVPHEDTLSPSTRFGDNRGEASMLFDLDPSLQYRQ